LAYENGDPALAEEVTQLKSEFAQAGIAITLTSEPFDSVIATATPEGRGWDMAFWSSGWTYAPDYEPTGDELWSCTGSGAGVQYAGADSGGYCNPQAEQDIVATLSSNDVHAMDTYDNYLAQQLPVIWMPAAYAQLSEINKALKGTQPQDPLLQIYPESWRWS
jgi:peptide/nickel transport system substrate-binding protein